MENDYLNGGRSIMKNAPCQFKEETHNELLEEIRGLRADFQANYNKLLDRATERVDNVIPIKSHYMILIGGLVILLGVAVVKEFLSKT